MARPWRIEFEGALYHVLSRGNEQKRIYFGTTKTVRTLWYLTQKHKSMSKEYPECPLVNHSNCRELHSPKLCAIVRKDKTCLRKIKRGRKKAKSGLINREDYQPISQYSPTLKKALLVN